jgi:dipeptide/tripeptide permease
MRRVAEFAIIIAIPILFALLMNQEDYIKAFIGIGFGCALGFVIIGFVVVSIRLASEKEDSP